MLLDPSDWSLAQEIERVLDALDPDLARRVDSETHRCVVELGTGVHRRRRRRRRRGAPAARVAGARPAAARAARGGRGHAPVRGLAGHASSRTGAATASSTARCASWRGASRRSRCTCTSACPTPSPAIRLLNRMRTHVPLLLALSANSPFWQGRDTGLASARTPLFQAFPRVGHAAHVPRLRRLGRDRRPAAALRGVPRADLPLVGRAPAAALRHRRGADHGRADRPGRHGRAGRAGAVAWRGWSWRRATRRPRR